MTRIEFYVLALVIIALILLWGRVAELTRRIAQMEKLLAQSRATPQPPPVPVPASSAGSEVDLVLEPITWPAATPAFQDTVPVPEPSMARSSLGATSTSMPETIDQLGEFIVTLGASRPHGRT